MCNSDTFYGIERDYFMKKSCINTAEEIAQQPEVWNELCSILSEKKQDIISFMEKAGANRRVIFTGAGSSAFVGDALSSLLAESNGVRTESIHSTDIVSSPASCLFDVPTLLISVARSGNSPESVGAVQYARSAIKDLYEVTILCDPDSNLSVEAEKTDKGLTLLMPENSNDKGFAMTSSVSCMMLTGFSLFNACRIDEIIQDISKLSSFVRNAGRRYTESAKEWAASNFDRIVYLGCGFLKHIAHEASLKMMELTNGCVNGSYEGAVGFRHGPKSVINDRTLTVHIISSNPFTARYDLDLMQEIYNQKKQNRMIALSAKLETACDESILIESDGYGIGKAICTGLQALVFCQMLAMFKSLELGMTTDNPSPAGEVNRVVKGITVYEY